MSSASPLTIQTDRVCQSDLYVTPTVIHNRALVSACTYTGLLCQSVSWNLGNPHFLFATLSIIDGQLSHVCPYSLRWSSSHHTHKQKLVYRKQGWWYGLAESMLYASEKFIGFRRSLWWINLGPLPLWELNVAPFQDVVLNVLKFQLGTCKAVSSSYFSFCSSGNEVPDQNHTYTITCCVWNQESSFYFGLAVAQELWLMLWCTIRAWIYVSVT